MTNATKHTSPPYNISPRTNFYKSDASKTEMDLMRLHGVSARFEAISIGGGKTNHTICLVPLDESSRETAAFIVRACNMHDELVEALCSMLIGGFHSSTTVDFARTALRKARGEA